MKTYEGVEVYLPLERATFTHCIGGLVNHVWTKWRSEDSWPYHDSNSDLSVVQPVASRYTNYAMVLYNQALLF
jgi:hypothetical protein